ncbi:uncharacterized protein LOC121423556 [Lytechinus variegatus]|uniref:uncharacterized protein LOC121423556 n=1 Tax=Lytechinus variegatus TaxID=7654 RepID=UPI001BB1B0F5|nr:uncharacterized protein LOC121423556 [Lytechinus variegatus]
MASTTIHATVVPHQEQGQISHHPTPDTKTTLESYNEYAGRATGWIQLVCGGGAIMVGVAQFLLGSSIRFAACGIWMSLLCFGPAGVLGIASYRRNRCVISAYLTMSVFSAVFAIFMTLIGAIGILISRAQECYVNTQKVPCQEGQVEYRVSSDGILTLIGLIETIVAIIGSAYGCAGVCCVKQPSRPRQEIILVNQYPATTSAHQQSSIPEGQPPPYKAVEQRPQQAHPNSHMEQLQTRRHKETLATRETHPHQGNYTTYQQHTPHLGYQPLILPNNQER